MSGRGRLGPDDSDRTIIVPQPGGRRAAPGQGTPAPAIGPLAVPAGADPLIAAAAPLLQLMARIRNTARPPDAGGLRARVLEQLQAFAAQARAGTVPAEQLQPAHYALCASLDDLVLNTPWGSTGRWAAQPLVATFHPQAGGQDRFFEVLERGLADPPRFLPLIGMMYLCLCLGFAGRQRQAPHGSADLEAIRARTYATLAQHLPGAPVALAPQVTGADAPYRPTPVRVPLWVAGGAGLAVLGLAFVGALGGLNAESDAVYVRMIQAAPAAMPQIIRSGPVQPPAVPADQPTVLDRLAQALAPQIAAGTLALAGSVSVPMVRIRSDALFTGAAVRRTSLPLLKAVGAALRTEAGAVQVIDYTDSQPTRATAYSSGFQLSAARARAAGRVLAMALGDTTRISTEGRADADPIASETTADGRARNRRIDIVLHRAGS